MTTDFRTFRVKQKVVESDIISSFVLEPTDGAPVWVAKPGQFLTIQIPFEGKTVLRTYSVSCDVAETGFHRITVKKETGLKGAPDGVGSCWLHEQVAVGDELEIAPPRGSFFLDEASDRPVLLLSGGVGLTPLVSMLHRLRQSDRDVYFLHACENGQVHALRDEVLGLASDRVRIHFVYRAPSDTDRSSNLFNAEGVIDKAFLQRTIPIGDYDTYICGPAPFMVAMYQLLLELGVPKNRIAYEFFGKATPLDKLAQATAPVISRQTASHALPIVAALTHITNPDAWAENDGPDVTHEVMGRATDDVTFKKSNKRVRWDGSEKSLLECAENAGLEPAFSCRAGICNSCKCRILEGEVEYFDDPLNTPEDGEVLICCARPKGAVVLDL